MNEAYHGWDLMSSGCYLRNFQYACMTHDVIEKSIPDENDAVFYCLLNYVCLPRNASVG